MMNDNQNNLFAKLAFGEDLNEIQSLLKSGINSDNHKDEDEYEYEQTVLNNTLFTGYLKRAKLLLENNANPNV